MQLEELLAKDLVADEETERYMTVLVPEEMSFKRILRSMDNHASLVSANQHVQRKAPTTRTRGEMIDNYVNVYKHHAGGGPKDNSALGHERKTTSSSPSPNKKVSIREKSTAASPVSPMPHKRSPHHVSPLSLEEQGRRRSSMGLPPTSSRSVASSVVTNDLVAEIRQKAALALAERRQKENTTERILDWSNHTPSKLISANTSNVGSRRQSVSWLDRRGNLSYDEGDDSEEGIPPTGGEVERASVGINADSIGVNDDDDVEAFYSDED